MEPILAWTAAFRRGAGGGVVIIRTQSGEYRLDGLAADEFSAFLAVLKQDQTTFYDSRNQAIISGPQQPGQ